MSTHLFVESVIFFYILEKSVIKIINAYNAANEQSYTQ